MGCFSKIGVWRHFLDFRLETHVEVGSSRMVRTLFRVSFVALTIIFPAIL
jgi:hypothetical protein